MKWSEEIFNSDERQDYYQTLSQLYSLIDKSPKKVFGIIYNFWEHDISRPLWELGFYEDYLACGNIVLAAARKMQRSTIEAQLLHEMGYCLMERERFDDSETYFKQSLAILETLDDLPDKCRINRYLAMLFYRQEKYDTAFNYLIQAELWLKKRKSNNDRWTLHACTIANLKGYILYRRGLIDESQESFERACELVVQLEKNREYYQMPILRGIAKFYFEQKQYNKARVAFEECLDRSAKIARIDMVSGVCIDLAKLHCCCNELETALTYAKKAAITAGSEHSGLREKAVVLQIQIKERMGRC